METLVEENQMTSKQGEVRFSQCIELPDGDFARPIVRLPNIMVDATKRDRTKFFRREPVVIKNLDNGCWTIALCLGAGTTKGITKQCLGIEYDTADILGINIYSKVEKQLVVQRASMFRKILWYLNHPDHGVRTSMWFGITGLISFADTIVSHVFHLTENLIKHFF